MMMYVGVCEWMLVWDSFMQRPVHLSFGRVKPIVDKYNYHWTGGGWVRKFSKIIDLVSYALKIGVTCVFVVYLKS